MSQATISLNLTAGDIAAILGADENGNLPIEITQNIANKFAERHLKGIADSALINAAEGRIRTAILTQLDEQIGKIKSVAFGQSSMLDLKPEIKQAIAERIESETNEFIKKCIAETMARLRGDIELRLKREIERMLKGQDMPALRQLTAISDHLATLGKMLTNIEKIAQSE